MDNRDLTAELDDAINRAEIEEVESLLARGADVNARDVAGDTMLINAAWVGAADIVRLLIARGADVNATGKDGLTALGLVRTIGHNEYGHEEVIDALLNAGAQE